MILNVERFIAESKPLWDELDAMLDRIERRAEYRLDIEEVKRLHYLYQRTASDLARLSTYAAEPHTRQYLEALVARAYGEIHETRKSPYRFKPIAWFFKTFPQTVRRHRNALFLAAGLMLAGAAFGAYALEVDPQAKSVLFPFPHLEGDPSDRVAMEESVDYERPRGGHGTFSGVLIVNNTRVTIIAMALGMTYGIGTIIILFYNGVILGAVCFDYLMAGEGVFLSGWLLPHGSVEIPAILLGGQAGLVLARGLVGWRDSDGMRLRMRKITPDLVTLVGGAAVFLAWAGIVESYFSQYHEPAIPYWLKISFGTVQLSLLVAFLTLSGRRFGRPERLSLRTAES